MKKIKVGLTLILMIFLSFSSAWAVDSKSGANQKPNPEGALTDSATYIIGPEDVLDIFVWKETELSRKVPVRLDGRISLPLVGEMQAAGLTPLRLKQLLIQRLTEFVDVPNVTVTVMEANSFKVYVAGQVKNPGVYTLRSETTVLQIIPIAGGFTEWANQRKVLLIRKEGGQEKRFSVNYKKIISGEDPGTNLVLKPGDTIVVPD